MYKRQVILLERGQIFNIEGTTFFTFGGASSHDTQGGILDRTACEFEFMVQRARSLYLPYRIIGESWWSQELTSEEEMQEGLLNLQKTDYKVDYVITHCCATELQNKIMSYVDGNSKPVSYTHLDVYKRQSCLSPSSRCSMPE